MAYAGLKSLSVFYDFPVRMTIGTADCGVLNAAYRRKDGRLVVCYELLALLDSINDRRDDVDIVAARIESVVAHELGHGLIAQLNLPTLGREEDAADQFAVWLLFDRLYSDDALMAVHGISGLIDTFGRLYELERQSPWVVTSTHGLTLARIGNLVCWTEGFVAPYRIESQRVSETGRNRWEEIASHFLSPERRQSCPAEARKIRDAWSRLLMPWAKQMN